MFDGTVSHFEGHSVSLSYFLNDLFIGLIPYFMYQCLEGKLQGLAVLSIRPKKPLMMAL